MVALYILDDFVYFYAIFRYFFLIFWVLDAIWRSVFTQSSKCPGITVPDTAPGAAELVRSPSLQPAIRRTPSESAHQSRLRSSMRTCRHHHLRVYHHCQRLRFNSSAPASQHHLTPNVVKIPVLHASDPKAARISRRFL